MRPLTVIVFLLIAGCVGPGPGPFQEEVIAARSTTDWLEEAPIELAGPGVALSPTDIMERMRAVEEGTFPGSEITTQTEDQEDGSVIGSMRTLLPGVGHPLRAIDTRLLLEESGDGWHVVALERRYHCATDQAAPLCE